MADDEPVDESSCELCYERPRALRFRPCGHATTCELCTLKLIAHSMNKTAKCPTCTAKVERIVLFQTEPDVLDTSGDADASAGTRSVFVRQPTFQRLDGEEEAKNSVDVEEFIASHAESDDEACKKASAAAKKAWRHGPASVVPDRALRLPAPNTRAAQLLALVGSTALVSVWLWGVSASLAAQKEFERLIHSGEYEVRVSALEALDGPVNVLLRPNQTCPEAVGWGGAALCAAANHTCAAVPCATTLPDPSPHQRWWGLVPMDQVGATYSPSDSRSVRQLVLVLIVVVGSFTVFKALSSALHNRPRALAELSHAGFNSMINMALLMSLFATYWDDSRQIVAINYFPGYAYVWLLVWVPLWILLLGLTQARRDALATPLPHTRSLARTRASARALLTDRDDPSAQALSSWPGLAGRCLHRLAVLACLVLLVYWVFWLLLPILGYSWFFAWRFVDVAVAQPRHNSTALTSAEDYGGVASLFADPPYGAASTVQVESVDTGGRSRAFTIHAAAELPATGPPFSDATAANLGPPFAATVWLGFACWALGTLGSVVQTGRHYYLLRHDETYRQARFLAAERRDNRGPLPGNPPAGQATQGTQTGPQGGGAHELV